MANTLNGVFLTRIAKLSLDALLATKLPVSSMFTDFSDEVVPYGNAVTTRYPNAMTAQNFASAKTAIGANTVSKTITLDKYVGVPISFTDTEMAFSDVKLMDLFIKPAITELFENVMATAQALITVSAYSSNTVITAANFTAANVAGLAQTLTTSKVPLQNRHIVVPPSYAVTLKKDTAVQAAYAYGSNGAITTGVLPPVYGFNIHEWNGTIPSTNNLAAYAFHPQALLVAARPPALPRNWYGEVANVTDPATGLTIQVRDYYDGTSQKTEWCFIYGCAVGNPGNLVRILSAAE